MLENLKVFRKSGVIHTLVEYVDLVASPVEDLNAYLNKRVGVGLYELRYASGGDVVGYNVHVFVVRRNGFTDELYIAQPATQEWGRLGFSFYTYSSAKTRLNELSGSEIPFEEEVL